MESMENTSDKGPEVLAARSLIVINFKLSTLLIFK